MSNKKKIKRRYSAPQIARDNQVDHALDEFAEALESSELVSEHNVVVRRVHSGPKLSAAILDFVAPYRSATPTYAAYHRLITLAVLGWNAAIVPEESGREMVEAGIRDAMPKSSPEEIHECRQIVAVFMKRKKQFFDEDKRLVVSFQLTETIDGFNLAVASTPVPDRSES